MHLIVTKQCIQWMEMYSPKFGGQIIFSYFSHPWGILDSRKRFSLAEIFLHIEKGPLLLRSGAPADPQFWSVLHILSSWIPPVWHSFPLDFCSLPPFSSVPPLSLSEKGRFPPSFSTLQAGPALVCMADFFSGSRMSLARRAMRPTRTAPAMSDSIPQSSSNHIWVGKHPFGYGSIPIDTFLVGWTSIYQLFWGSLGTRVLTHPHLGMVTTYKPGEMGA